VVVALVVAMVEFVVVALVVELHTTTSVAN